MNRQLTLVLLLSVTLGTISIAQTKKTAKKQTSVATKDTISQAAKGSVTFVELGSVNCIPCRQMQPVMKAIEQKYGQQVKVIFHDVWKEDQKHYAQKYGIRLIPTQVFLDDGGKEILRHEGFFPEKDIDAFLQSKGLKAANKVD